MTKEVYTIDAAGRSIGRVATEAAIALRGKDQPDFERHVLSNVKVKIENASKVKITGNKMTGKVHSRYSGYPGGFKSLRQEQLVEKKGFAEPMRLAVYGMLPGNKLRARMMNNLTITE